MRRHPKKVLAPLFLTVPPLILLGLVFWALWPKLRQERGWKGVAGLFVVTVFVCLPSVAFAVDAAFL